jgi:cytochrome P450
MSDRHTDPLRPPNGYHPVDPTAARDPFAQLAELRASCPISHPEMEGFPPLTLLTRYADVTFAYRDYKTFGNIGFFPSMAAYNAMDDTRRSIIELDPPRHTAVRRLNLLAMKPAAVAEALPRIEQVAVDLIGKLRPEGRAELVQQLAVPLPADAVATVLGLPNTDADMIHEWVESTFSEPPDKADVQRAVRPGTDVNGDFNIYLHEQLAWRRTASSPPDDAITRMLAFEDDDGTKFTDDELVVHIRTLLMAGNETTTSLISNLVYRLLSVPTAYERVRDDRVLVEPFIEECLRYDSPLTQFPRRVRVPTEIGGVQLQEDDVLSLSLPSANRDAAQFGDDAEEFRIDRFVDRHPDHLSFGLGVHHCVGAYLARQTTRIALTALLDGLDDLALAPGYEYDKVWFFEFRRPKRLDVVFRAG